MPLESNKFFRRIESSLSQLKKIYFLVHSLLIFWFFFLYFLNEFSVLVVKLLSNLFLKPELRKDLHEQSWKNYQSAKVTHFL